MVRKTGKLAIHHLLKNPEGIFGIFLFTILMKSDCYFILDFQNGIDLFAKKAI